MCGTGWEDFPPGMCFVLMFLAGAWWMTTWRVWGKEGVFGHVKGHLWGFRGPSMIDRVPLQVAVISLICGEVLSLPHCVCMCVCVWRLPSSTEGVQRNSLSFVFVFYWGFCCFHHYAERSRRTRFIPSLILGPVCGVGAQRVVASNPFLQLCDTI